MSLSNRGSAVTLESETPKHTVLGTHRSRAPEESVEIAKAVAPRIGITRVADVTGLDRIGIPTVMVCRPNSRSLSVAQGKGVDLAQARASGLMESIESWHAERADLELRLASLRDLRQRGADVIDVDGLARRTHSRFTPDLRILWALGRSLLDDRDVWAPYEAVHLDMTLPLPTGSGCFAMSSNGIASGNCVSEALVHALSEVIERDAAMLFKVEGANVQQDRGVDLESVSAAPCRELLDRIDVASVGVIAWDITSDIGVPCFMVELHPGHDDHHRRLMSARGYGCHPDSAVALSRALTEAAQSRLTSIVGSRDDNLFDLYDRHRDQQVLARLRTNTATLQRSREFASVGSLATPSFEGDVRTLLACLAKVGIEDVVWFDFTRSDIGIPVVKVVVPGLESSDHHPLTRRGSSHTVKDDDG